MAAGCPGKRRVKMPGLARHPGRTHSVSEVGLWCVKDRTIPPEKTEALCTSVGACAGIRHCDRRRCAAGRRTSQRVPTRPQHNRGCGVLAAPTGRVTLPRDYGAVRRIYLTQRRKAYFSRREAGARRDAAPPKAHADAWRDAAPPSASSPARNTTGGAASSPRLPGGSHFRATTVR